MLTIEQYCKKPVQHSNEGHGSRSKLYVCVKIDDRGGSAAPQLCAGRWGR